MSGRGWVVKPAASVVLALVVVLGMSVALSLATPAGQDGPEGGR